MPLVPVGEKELRNQELSRGLTIAHYPDTMVSVELIKTGERDAQD